jgi:MraZ protein
MFRGASALNLDSKGRLAIPVGYRDELVERSDGKMVVTVTNTQEQCLWLYPLDEWSVVEEKVVKLSSFDPVHQKFKRFFIGYAREVEMDKSGRILLPATLRTFALLEKSVYLVGQGNKFEIWNEELWNAKCEQWLKEDLDVKKLSVELEQISL